MKKTNKLIALTILLGIFFVPFVSAASLSDAKDDSWNFQTETFGTSPIDIKNIIIIDSGIQIQFQEDVGAQMGENITGIFAFLHLYNATDSVSFMLAFAWYEEYKFMTMDAMFMFLYADNSTDGAEIYAILMGDSIYIPFPVEMMQYTDVELMVIQMTVELDQEEAEMQPDFFDWYPNSVSPADFQLFDMFEQLEMNDPEDLEILLGMIEEVPDFEETLILTDILESENLWIYVILAVLLITTISLAVMLARKPKQMTPEQLKYQKKEMKLNEKRRD